MKHARTLGLAVLAIAALTALVGVSSASAAQYKSNSSPVMLFGEQEGTHVFKVQGQSVTCKKAVFEKASLATPANTVPGVTASYNECTAFGFAGATVNMGNCTYELQQPGNENATNKDFTANVGIRCSGASNINVSSSVFGSECKASIHETSNTLLPHLLIKNGPGAQVNINITVTSITVTVTIDNGLCPLKGVGTTTESSYEGKLPVGGTGGIGVSVG